MPNSWSIRHYLIAIILAMALPLMGLLIYSSQQNYEAAIGEAGSDAQRSTEVAAADLRRFTRDAHQFLIGLAHRPQTQQLNAAACDPLLPDVKQFFPQFANIAVLDREGQMICSSVAPKGAKLPSFANSAWVKEAQATNGFHIGAAHLGPVSKKWVVVFSEAIQDAQGAYNGLVGFSLDLASFSLLGANAETLPSGMSLVVVDAKDKVIMRSNTSPEQIGDHYPIPEALALSRSNKSGNQILGSDRTGKLIAFATVEGTGWRVIGSRPAANILDGLWIKANIQYAEITLLILIGSLLAVYVARRIERPMLQIAQTAMSIANGDFNSRAKLDGPKEIASVATQFNFMLDVRLKAEEKYRNLLEAASDGIVVVNPMGIILLANDQAMRSFGYEQGELVGKSIQILVPEDRRDHHQSLIKGFFAEPTHKLMGRIVRGRRRDGSEFPCDIGLSHLHTEDGLVVSAIIRDLSERTDLEEKLAYLAHHDPLTSLPNRSLLHDRLEQAIARSQRDIERIAVIQIDIDRFGELNDFHGARYADQVLITCAKCIRECLRDIDTVIRSGSDEFLVIIEDDAPELVVQNFVERLHDALAGAFSESQASVPVSVSCGAAIFPCEGGAEGLLKNADLALMHARSRGTGGFSFFETVMDVRASSRLKIITQLRGALARGEFEVHYQPQVDTHTGQPVGAEALLRWTNPELGSVSPAQFIPLAEETGLIEAIGEWVLRTACQQGIAWNQAGFSGLTVAVNLSARQFRQENLLDIVASALRDSGLPAAQLELEITEGMLMEHPELAAATLHCLSQMGVHISIDDFGTGYSSLSYLRRFPVNILKIDQSFVRELPANEDDIAIVSAIISLAHNLRIHVIAEGVETEAQRQFLSETGCEVCQGYLFGRAMPPAELTKFLAADRVTGYWNH